eukprot:CAMPEP_0114519580 /NCGR_PEP_ID=MMETSP0109-20121206/19091_1 /TAXON_ID=29199 /ORGANISM="Chlorarachnion reptans, Strain CCCM449" /LENGTH=298 /DNA_ID=CAMNT_0001700353 /DNA_START=78 /DNA_END=974 /DNA_ORIENTATION=+
MSLGRSLALRERGGAVSLSTSVVGRRHFSAEVADELLVRRCEGDYAGIVELSMNRPKARNALSKNLVDRMEETLAEIEFDTSVRAVILRSATAGMFCAGADLKERAKMAPEEVGPFVAKLRRLVSSFANVSVPVIAAIDGAALGGGLEIALACDMRVASDNAKMGLVETKLAIIPGAGGTQRLPRLVGPAIAKELVFTAKIINGSEAKDIGLVNAAVEQNENGDAAAGAALEMAKSIVPNGPIGVRMAKVAISKGIETSLETGLAIEQACYAQVIPTEDRLEGLAAFREKRTPQYKGK